MFSLLITSSAHWEWSDFYLNYFYYRMPYCWKGRWERLLVKNQVPVSLFHYLVWFFETCMTVILGTLLLCNLRNIVLKIKPVFRFPIIFISRYNKLHIKSNFIIFPNNKKSYYRPLICSSAFYLYILYMYVHRTVVKKRTTKYVHCYQHSFS